MRRKATGLAFVLLVLIHLPGCCGCGEIKAPALTLAADAAAVASDLAVYRAHVAPTGDAAEAAKVERLGAALTLNAHRLAASAGRLAKAAGNE